jgi:hypothetical protein
VLQTAAKAFNDSVPFGISNAWYDWVEVDRNIQIFVVVFPHPFLDSQ